MGLWKGAKKVAKYSAFEMPMRVFGVNAIKIGNAQIRDLWRSITLPLCPHCNKGVMQLSSDFLEQTETEILYPWVCSKCDFQLLCSADVESVRSTIRTLRNEMVKSQISELELEGRQEIAAGHAKVSRAYFIAAAIASVGFLYMLGSGASMLLAANWLAISFAFTVFALKKSYRHWQVMTGNVFMPGAFWFWLKNEKWLV